MENHVTREELQRMMERYKQELIQYRRRSTLPETESEADSREQSAAEEDQLLPDLPSRESETADAKKQTNPPYEKSNHSSLTKSLEPDRSQSPPDSVENSAESQKLPDQGAEDAGRFRVLRLSELEEAGGKLPSVPPGNLPEANMTSAAYNSSESSGCPTVSNPAAEHLGRAQEGNWPFFYGTDFNQPRESQNFRPMPQDADPENGPSLTSSGTGAPAEDNTAGPEIPYPEDATGYLVVRAFTARNALPIEGATVTVMRHKAGSTSGEVLKITRTGPDGNTPVMELPTVKAELSEVPGNPCPYSTYDVQIDYPGNFSILNVGVPVYDGIKSLQPAEMVPLPENFQGNPVQTTYETEDILTDPTA